MLHTNITSFFLGSMNRVQAERPRQTPVDAVMSSICDLTELMGFTIQETVSHIAQKCHNILSGNPDRP